MAQSDQGTQYYKQRQSCSRRLSDSARQQIISMHFGSSLTMRQISDQLSVPISTISGIVQIFRNTGRVVGTSRKGTRKGVRPEVLRMLRAWKARGFSMRKMSQMMSALPCRLGKSQISSYLASTGKSHEEGSLQVDACMQFDNSLEFADLGIQCELDFWSE